MLRGIDEYGFARSRACFEEIVGFLDGEGANALSHADLEDRLNIEGRELLRLLYQDHLDLRAERELRLERVVDADGVDRPSVEAGHTRTRISGRRRVSPVAREDVRARDESGTSPSRRTWTPGSAIPTLPGLRSPS